MATIFHINGGGNDDDDDYNEKINLDDLYDKKKEDDLTKLAIYKKMLSRIHVRIKTCSRQKKNNQFCWFVVPEVILGCPKYDQASCIAYVIEQLRENGFIVTYTHPNMLFISWKHWVPGYVRNEIKKRTGVSIDGYGNLVNEEEEKVKDKNNNNNNVSMFSKNKVNNSGDKASPFKSTDTYKPTSHIVYDEKIMKKLHDKL
tara:strand:- start:234 stop:836 length:603 start_codon:yes stop_codon:yes gene_type:complete